GPHCNILGLSELGEKMIREMAERGMIFDPDHMSAKAQTEALDLLEEMGYSGIVSSHGWSNETIYPRIYELGGVVTPYAGNSTTFVEAWREHRSWEDDRFFFGFGYGADTNGFGSQGAPRGADATNPVEYPFQGFGGVTIDQQQSGTRTYDVNVDGVAHYGLYPDWIEDLRRLGGDEIIEDMARGPEAYLQMWERAIGIAPDSCRPDVADLRPSQLRALEKGMSPEAVLRAIGQPAERVGRTFNYCATGGRNATVEFTRDGAMKTWTLSSG
ncbi:MAG: dipeptidase, partial [Actinomycetota bacterium]|nr:dipeptidase [Actinomycetota bacterium]